MRHRNLGAEGGWGICLSPSSRFHNQKAHLATHVCVERGVGWGGLWDPWLRAGGLPTQGAVV